MSLSDWLLFSSITLAATLSPGPAILLVVSVSMRFGPGACVASIGGNITGLLIMASLSVAGVSYLILHSDTAFLLVKAVGALYLIYLGIKLWRTDFSLRTEATEEYVPVVPGAMRRYFQGVLIALTNPKAIVFMTALLPQFIDSAAPLAPQFGVLVMTFMVLSAGCLTGYALLVARITGLSARWKNSRLMNRVFGSAFVSAGVALAFATNK